MRRQESHMHESDRGEEIVPMLHRSAHSNGRFVNENPEGCNASMPFRRCLTLTTVGESLGL